MRKFLTSNRWRASEASGWRLVGLYFYYFLLSAVAAALAGIFATAPYWIPSLVH
jgi:ribose/xylose/arabinose/galactoside ABC-type transport system permease subunit